MRTLFLTGLAMLAFAGNSILCRLALRDGAIDPATFSTARIIAGAMMLAVVARFTASGRRGGGVSWLSAVILFVYAVPFALAYVSLSTGTGALILFGSVQLTMMFAAVWMGERPHTLQWTGLGLALAGLIYLVLPGLEAPPPAAAGLMAVAGCAWGFYSLRGRGVSNPLLQTAANFARAVPLAIGANLLALAGAHASPRGVALAAVSGAVTSGLGYVVWYAALSGLTATRAAVVQLGVPLLTGLAGIVFLSEAVPTRLVTATPLVLGGIALAVLGRERVPAERVAVKAMPAAK